VTCWGSERNESSPIHPLILVGFLDSDLTQVDFSIQYTDQHDSFSVVSETGKAKEKAETSSATFLISKTNEKLPCSSVCRLEKSTRIISSSRKFNQTWMDDSARVQSFLVPKNHQNHSKNFAIILFFLEPNNQ